MNMQQFTGWVTRLLDALPWRRAHRSPKPQVRARVTSPSQANRFAFPDDQAIRRQKAETNPLCSTLPEEAPAPHEPPTAPQPLLLPATITPEILPAPLLALPPPPSTEASDVLASSEPSGGATPMYVDPERRLAFARYLFRRGVFNEGFTHGSVPAQYHDRAAQDEGPQR